MADPELLENYDVVANERGWSTDQMAEHLAARDPRLAAEYRSHAAPARASAPKKRRTRDLDEG